jgi:hypothetical protein
VLHLTPDANLTASVFQRALGVQNRNIWREYTRKASPRARCQAHNNHHACTRADCEWSLHPGWGEAAPDCFAGQFSGENRNSGGFDGDVQQYLWKIPEAIVEANVPQTCVLRLRYNVTPGEFEVREYADFATKFAGKAMKRAEEGLEPWWMRIFPHPAPSGARVL